MSKIKEGKVVRERLEEIFDTKFFYQPGTRQDGKWNLNLIRDAKKCQNCDSLEIYRSLEHGYEVGLRTLFHTKFFCIDIDNKSGKPSVYFNELQPILNSLDDLGLEGRLICASTAKNGGIKIWIPLPILIVPQTFNDQLEQYFRLQGIFFGKGVLELLSRRPTIGDIEHYHFGTGGRRPYVTNVTQTGDLIRLPHCNTEYLQFNNPDDEPKQFTLDEFFSNYWQYCVDVNSEFNYDTIKNKIQESTLEFATNNNTASNTSYTKSASNTTNGTTSKTSLEGRATANLNTGSAAAPAAIVQRVMELDTTSTSTILETKNQVSTHGGKRKGAGRKSGTKEDHYLEGTFFSSARHPQSFIERCLDRVNQGWTSSGQSSDILACLAVVVSHTYRTFNDLEMAKEMLTIIPKIKGFEEHASSDTKKDLAQPLKRNWARRWAKSVFKYREQLFSKSVLSRTWDYALKFNEKAGEWWRQSLDENGKPTNKSKGCGKGRGGLSWGARFPKESIDVEAELAKLEQDNFTYNNY